MSPFTSLAHNFVYEKMLTGVKSNNVHRDNGQVFILAEILRWWDFTIFDPFMRPACVATSEKIHFNTFAALLAASIQVFPNITCSHDWS